MIDDLKKKASEMTAEAERRLSKRTFSGPPISTGDAGAARARGAPGARGGGRAVPRRRGAAPRAAGDRRRASPSIGDRVVVAGLGLEGTLAALHGDEAEVDMQGKRLRARVADLRLRVEGRRRRRRSRRAE